MTTKKSSFSRRSYVDLVVNVQETRVNQQANSSTVKVDAYIYCANGQTYNLESTSKIKLSVEGNIFYSGTTYDFRRKSKALEISKSVDIPHRADGGKILTVIATFSDDFLGSARVVIEIPLTDIRRGTQFTFQSSIYADASSIDAKVKKIDASDYDKVEYHVNGVKIEEWNRMSMPSTGSVSFPLDTSARSKVHAVMKTTTSVQGNIKVTTFKSNGTQLGTREYPVRVVLSSSERPRVMLMGITTTTRDLDGNVWNIAVENIGTIQAIIYAKASQGATITKIEASHDGKKIKTDGDRISFTPTAVESDSTAIVSYTVQDSRGLVTAGAERIPVAKYHPPYYEFFDISRGGAGEAQEKVLLTHAYGRIAPVSSRGKVNSAILTVEATSTRGGSPIEILRKTGSNAENTTKHTDQTTSLSMTDAYNIKITYRDKFSKVEIVRKLGTGSTPLAISKVGIGVNKIPEPNRNFDGRGSFYWNGTPFNFVRSPRVRAELTINHSNVKRVSNCRAYKDTFANRVTLAGYIFLDMSSGTRVAQLPSGYRPSEAIYFPIPNESCSGSIAIYTDGEIHMRHYKKLNSEPWISLNHVSFLLGT